MAKIMIVDDESSVRVSVKMVLETEGFEVDEAKTADECLMKLDKGEIPDLILLDVMMPGMKPIDLLEKMQQDPNYKKIPVIYASAVTGIEEGSKDVKGIVDAIEKPFKNEVLIEKVKKALN